MQTPGIIENSWRLVRYPNSSWFGSAQWMGLLMNLN